MYKRLIIPEIRESMEFMRVVSLEGPRRSGKSTIVKSIMQGKSPAKYKRSHGPWAHYDLDDADDLGLVKHDTRGLFFRHPEGCVVIEEVQGYLILMLAVKEDADRHDVPGRSMVTVSANYNWLPKIPDTLAGRVATVRVSTLSESEILGTEPSFLANMMAGRPPEDRLTRGGDRLLDRVVAGCFPEALALKDEARRTAWHRKYVAGLVREDIKSAHGVRRVSALEKLAETCMASTAEIVNVTKLAHVHGLNERTVGKVLYQLETWFLVEQVRAWHYHKAKNLSRKPKLHVSDTGLACSVLGLGKKRLARDYLRYGKLVESFVFGELRKQLTFLEDDDFQFSHFQDKYGHKVDIIIERFQGECYAVDVKSGTSLDDRDFRNMRRFKEAAGDRFKMGVILYNGDHTMRFGEGMYAAPLASLWA